MNINYNFLKRKREHIVSKYYWKGIQDYVSEFVKKCEKCRSDQEQKNTTSKINHEVSLIASDWEKESKMDVKVNRNLSFQKFNLSVYMDILGPLIRTKKKNLYCVVLTNNDTKWSEGFPLSEIDTEVITGFIYEFICRHGYPMQLLVSPLSCLDVDNFHTKLETDMNNRIQKDLFHINVDPTVVIFNEEIKKLLNTFITSLPLLKNKWDDHLPALMLYYNSFPNPTDSPYFKTYNKHFIPSTGGISNEENKLWLWTKAILEEFQSNLDYENEQAPPL
ncbi:Gypsy retrotransposon integrase-like protein 1 [Armadillidium vulgare]|nr:Gypsy retrotransposon integrase-like protein 1 [Armadillidium vulgare]